MGLLATVKRLGTRSLGGFVACLLLLPLPVLAYTINNTWSFFNNGVSLDDHSTDHKSLTYTGSNGGPGDSADGFNTITGTAGEKVNLSVNLQGLFIFSGSLTISYNIGGTGAITETVTSSNFQGTITDDMTHATFLTLAGGTQNLHISFLWSSNASFQYFGGTAANVFFGTQP